MQQMTTICSSHLSMSKAVLFSFHAEYNFVCGIDVIFLSCFCSRVNIIFPNDIFYFVKRDNFP